MTIIGTWMESILVFIATGLSIAIGLSPWSEIKAIQKRGNVGQVSYIPYIGIAFSSCNGTVYALLAQIAPMFFVNVINSLLGFYYLYIYYQYAHGMHRTLKIVYSSAIFLFLLIIYYIYSIYSDPLTHGNAVSSMGNICLIALIFMFGAPLSTIKEVIRSKDASSIPVALTFATFFNCVTWGLYGWIREDFYIWSPNLVGLIFSSINLLLLKIYGSPKVLLP